MPLLDHFGLIAPLYERTIRPRDEAKTINALHLPVTGALLDAGGGTGRISGSLRGFAGQIVVSDLSMGMLRQARNKPGLSLSCAYTERLPFPDGSFERVLMVDALHHVCSQAETAAELWRVTRSGGRIVIEEPDVRKWAVKLIAIAEKFLLMRSHLLDPEAIMELFTHRNASVNMSVDGYYVRVTIDKL